MSCRWNSINGNGNVVIKDRKANNNFTKISTKMGLDVYVTQGAKNSITVEADENLHDIIFTEITNGTLEIYSDKNIWKANAKKVHVTIKNIELLSASSGGSIYSEEKITSKDVIISAASGADIKISIDAANIETNVASGANISINGKSQTLITNAASGSSVSAYNLQSKNVVARASSGANINIYASENMEASASSGGHIGFKGNPKKVTKKSSSGGSISAR